MPLELVSLVVDDYDAAIEFFTGPLGFVLSEDSPSMTTEGRPKRWVVVRPADGGTGLVLARADGEDQAAVVGRQFAGRVGLFLRVEDFDDTLARIRHAGCDLVRPVRDETYGRVCVFRDLGQPVGSSRPQRWVEPATSGTGSVEKKSGAGGLAGQYGPGS